MRELYTYHCSIRNKFRLHNVPSQINESAFVFHSIAAKRNNDEFPTINLFIRSKKFLSATLAISKNMIFFFKFCNKRKKLLSISPSILLCSCSSSLKCYAFNDTNATKPCKQKCPSPMQGLVWRQASCLFL